MVQIRRIYDGIFSEGGDFQWIWCKCYTEDHEPEETTMFDELGGKHRWPSHLLIRLPDESVPLLALTGYGLQRDGRSWGWDDNLDSPTIDGLIESDDWQGHLINGQLISTKGD